MIQIDAPWGTFQIVRTCKSLEKTKWGLTGSDPQRQFHQNHSKSFDWQEKWPFFNAVVNAVPEAQQVALSHVENWVFQVGTLLC